MLVLTEKSQHQCRFAMELQYKDWESHERLIWKRSNFIDVLQCVELWFEFTYTKMRINCLLTRPPEGQKLKEYRSDTNSLWLRRTVRSNSWSTRILDKNRKTENCLLSNTLAGLGWHTLHVLGKSRRDPYSISIVAADKADFVTSISSSVSTAWIWMINDETYLCEGSRNWPRILVLDNTNYNSPDHCLGREFEGNVRALDTYYYLLNKTKRALIRRFSAQCFMSSQFDDDVEQRIQRAPG
jgi:hypothetical protein